MALSPLLSGRAGVTGVGWMMVPLERIHYLIYGLVRLYIEPSVNARCVYPATLVAERGPHPTLLLDRQGSRSNFLVSSTVV